MYIFLSIIISHLFPSHYFYFCFFLFPFLILYFCRHNFLFSSSSFSAYSCPVSKSTPRKVKSRKAREYFAATSLFVFCGDASRQGRKNNFVASLPQHAAEPNCVKFDSSHRAFRFESSYVVAGCKTFVGTRSPVLCDARYYSMSRV